MTCKNKVKLNSVPFVYNVAMAETNPYAPPAVAQTVNKLPNETLFHYRYSTRNLGTTIAVLPLLTLAAMPAIGVLRAGALPQQFPSQLLFPLVAAIVFLLICVGGIFYIAIRPRVWEFRVERESVCWRTPWPRAAENQLQTSSIERVEYLGQDITIDTIEGERFEPIRSTHGWNAIAVVEAIKAAITEQEPRTRVQQHSESTWRTLGQYVGRILRWLRGPNRRN